MKKQTSRALLASVFMLALSGTSFAADLPEKVTINDIPINASDYDWTGAYAGIAVGFGVAGNFDNGGPLDDDDAAGFIGGGVFGYNHQIDKFVLGIEGDISYSDLDASAAGISAELDFLGTVTGRIGYTPTSRILTYFEGGYAFGQADLSSATGSDDNFLNGFVVGAGAEYALTDNITSGVEYNYINLEDDSFDLGASGIQSSDFDAHVIRFNVKYKF